MSHTFIGVSNIRNIIPGGKVRYSIPHLTIPYRTVPLVVTMLGTEGTLSKESDTTAHMKWQKATGIVPCKDGWGLYHKKKMWEEELG